MTKAVFLVILVAFTCAHPDTLVPKTKECKDTPKGTDYRGTLSKTREGFTCQEWASNTPHTHNLQPADGEAASNFCRNPDNGKEPWCFTTDPKRTYDYCDVPPCSDAKVEETSTVEVVEKSEEKKESETEDNSGNNEEVDNKVPAEVFSLTWLKPSVLTDCKWSKKGTRYKGEQSTTRKGYTCQAWASNTPHKPKSKPKDKKTASNYCRNPRGRAKEPWCYTTDPEKRRDYCDIPLCVGARSGKVEGYNLQHKVCSEKSLAFAVGANVSFRDCKNACDERTKCMSFGYSTPFIQKTPHSKCQLFRTSCEEALATPHWPKTMKMEHMMIPHHYIKELD